MHFRLILIIAFSISFYNRNYKKSLEKISTNSVAAYFFSLNFFVFSSN